MPDFLLKKKFVSKYSDMSEYFVNVRVVRDISIANSMQMVQSQGNSLKFRKQVDLRLPNFK